MFPRRLAEQHGFAPALPGPINTRQPAHDIRRPARCQRARVDRAAGGASVPSISLVSADRIPRMLLRDRGSAPWRVQPDPDDRDVAEGLAGCENTALTRQSRDASACSPALAITGVWRARRHCPVAWKRGSRRTVTPSDGRHVRRGLSV
jgi:hypothetical protein